MPNARAVDACAGVSRIDDGPLTFLTTTIPDAALMDVDALRGAVAAAYRAIGDTLGTARRSAIRMWNYLPHPGHPMGPGLDRYMVFNAGRHDGYRSWFGGSSAFGPSLATASGVGIHGDALAVHCLASATGGIAVENARQKPAWRYSARYGPLPPAFARATIATVGARRLLLIGGTASVIGEDSVHVGDVAAQLEETLENMGTLIAGACGDAVSPRLALDRIADLRVYITRGCDAPLIAGTIRSSCPGAARMELAVARLCRPELLVEIEGVAGIDDL